MRKETKAQKAANEALAKSPELRNVNARERFSENERDRIMMLINESADTHKVLSEAKHATEAERILFKRDSELMERAGRFFYETNI